MNKIGFTYHEFLDMPYHLMGRLIDRHIEFEEDKHDAQVKAQSGTKDATLEDADAMFG